MENRIRRILLSSTGMRHYAVGLCLSLMSALVSADQTKPLIEPDVDPVPVSESLIDSENFEAGVFAGVLSIEDFESAPIYGARLAYHISENLMFEAHYGVSEAGQSSYENLGFVQVLSSDERDYQYYSVGVGLKLPGQSYFGKNYAFNNNVYLSLGLGSTDFAGDEQFSWNFGFGYQLLLTDYFSVHMNAKQHIYEIDVVSEKKTSFNTEISSGISFYF